MAKNFTPTELILPTVRAQKARGRWTINEIDHRLHWNEHPFDLPAELRNEILQRLEARQWSTYPEFRPYSVIDGLAEFCDLQSDQIIVMPSSSALIRLIFSAIISVGDHVVIPTPSFGQYRGAAAVQGGVIHAVPIWEEKGFALPVDELIAVARENDAKLVVVCAPNNPTGTVYAQADVARIAAKCGCLLLVDEAYAQFGGSDMIPVLEAHDNVILARTFSKAFAMAGVRLGYGVASSAIATELGKLVPSFPLNHFGEITAQVALENPEYMQTYTRQIVSERNRLAEAIDQVEDTTVFSSGTNFLLIRMGNADSERPAKLVQYLKDKHRLLINDLNGYPELAGCVRISVGTSEQNDMVLEGWRHFEE